MCITIQDLHINLVCNLQHITNRFKCDQNNSYYEQDRKHNNIHRIFNTYPLCTTALTFQDSSKWWCQTNATNPCWRRLNSGQFQINHLSSSSSTTHWPEQWKATARSLIDMFCSAAVVMSTPSFFSIKPPPSTPSPLQPDPDCLIPRDCHLSCVSGVDSKRSCPNLLLQIGNQPPTAPQKAPIGAQTPTGANSLSFGSRWLFADSGL